MITRRGNTWTPTLVGKHASDYTSAETRPGRIALGKSGQGAMRDTSGPTEIAKIDDYHDISPRTRKKEKSPFFPV